MIRGKIQTIDHYWTVDLAGILNYLKEAQKRMHCSGRELGEKGTNFEFQANYLWCVTQTFVQASVRSWTACLPQVPWPFWSVKTTRTLILFGRAVGAFKKGETFEWRNVDWQLNEYEILNFEQINYGVSQTFAQASVRGWTASVPQVPSDHSGV